MQAGPGSNGCLPQMTCGVRGRWKAWWSGWPQAEVVIQYPALTDGETEAKRAQTCPELRSDLDQRVPKRCLQSTAAVSDGER